MTNDEANLIMHSGKKGMKWGVRNKGNISLVATAGLKLGNKKKYTNPEASALRAEAGKSRTRSLLIGVGMLVANKAANNSTGSTRVGFRVATSLLQSYGIATRVVGIMDGIKANQIQNIANNKNS